MSRNFCMTSRARAELDERLRARGGGQGVCQFIFDHEARGASSKPVPAHESREFGPLQRILDAIGSSIDPGAATLEIGIYDQAVVPADQVRSISGIAFQLDDYWYRELAGFELDYDKGLFKVRRSNQSI